MMCKDYCHPGESEEKTFGRMLAFKSSMYGVDGYFEVYMDFANGNINVDSIDEGGMPVQHTRQLDPSEGASFFNRLEEINILSWDPEYHRMDILDGLGWRVEIIFVDGAIIKHGSNKFPREWDEYCRLLKAITGQSFYWNEET